MIMEKKRYYIKHINDGFLVRTKSGMPAYIGRFDFSLVWLGTHTQAEKKLAELGEQYHDMGEILC